MFLHSKNLTFKAKPNFYFTMKIRFRFLFIVWMLAMLTVSSIPDLEIISHWHLTWKDKIVHFAEYSIWALLFLFMLKQENRISNMSKTFFLVCSYGLLLIVIDELHQLFIPGRSADVLNMVADFSGVILMTFIFNWAQKHRLNLKSVREK